MIGKLQGTIDSIYEDHVILNVGGVGYQVFVTTSNIAEAAAGRATTFFIETHVREDRIQLYGFINLDEKKAFLILQNVSGIGTRLALTILSYFSPSQLRELILHKDKQSLKSIPGVGLKLAERMLVELKDKFEEFIGDNYGQNSPHMDSEIKSDAISALTNLGIERLIAINTVNHLLQNDPEIKLDALIKLALKNPIR